MDQIAFCLVGVVTGIGSALMLVRFDEKWLKAISLSGGAAILIAEFLAFAELLSINDDNRSLMLVCLLSSWLITFLIASLILLWLFKMQVSGYKIQIWEILLGDKKTIEQYYISKKSEIEKMLESKYNVDKLRYENTKLEQDRENVLNLKKRS